MTINRNNYEEFFLDYYEHALDAGQVAELMVFLEANPDLNEAFEAFESIFLVPEKTSFTRKQKLKKKEYKDSGDITALNYEEFMVAAMEQDLSGHDRRQLTEFLSANPEARLEYDLFLKTRLKPEPLAYPGKADLRKRMLFVYRRQVAAAVALAASLLVLIALWMQQPDAADRPGMSESGLAPQMDPLPAPASLSTDPGMLQIDSREPAPGSPRAALAVQRSKENVPVRVRPVAPLEGVPDDQIAIASSPIYTTPFINDRYLFRESLEASLLAALEEEQPSFAIRFIKGTFNKVFQGREGSGKTLLEYTVDGYNLLADRDVDVEKHYDPSGRIVAYRVNGEVIKFGRQVNPPMGE